MLVLGVLAARRHRVRAHKITMISIFAGALILAGLFTLVPGRLMHGVCSAPEEAAKNALRGGGFSVTSGGSDSPPRRAASTARKSMKKRREKPLALTS